MSFLNILKYGFLNLPVPYNLIEDNIDIKTTPLLTANRDTFSTKDGKLFSFRIYD